MSLVEYCSGWNRVFKAPAEKLSAECALRLHEKRRPYCAIVSEAEGTAVVEMCFFEIYCHVLFLDDRKRVASRYSFAETASGQLFLQEVAVHYYTSVEDRPSHGEIFVFKEDGAVEHDVGRSGGPLTRQKGRTDVSRNYAAPPEFGNYDSILVRER